MRVFIAIPVSPELKIEADIIQSEIKKLFPNLGVKWVDSALLHVTLEFLGELGETRLLKAKQIAENIAAQSEAFTMQLDKLDCFPNYKEPQTIVLTIGQGAEKAGSLQALLRAKLNQENFPLTGKEWLPHITIGRIKNGSQDLSTLTKLKMEKIEWSAGSIEIVKSDLTSAGPVYTVIESYKICE